MENGELLDKLAGIIGVHKNSLGNNNVKSGMSYRTMAAALVIWRDKTQETVDFLNSKIARINDAILFLIGDNGLEDEARNEQ